MTKTYMLQQLASAEQLAQASRLVRLLRAPGRYFYAIGFRLLRYRTTKKGVVARAVTFFDVPMAVVLPASTDLYLTGAKSHDSEIRLARFLIQRLPVEGVFWDVGAHYGYFSLLAAQLVGPQGEVLAFEASRATYAVLAENVANNSAVRAQHCAVSDKEETLAFYEFPVLYNEYNSLDIQQFAQEKWFTEFPPTKIEVPAVTLTSLLGQTNRPPDVLKIDVEGAELRVIQGAKGMLRHASPAVVLEYLESHRHNTIHRQAAALLAKLGYQPHRIGPTGELLVCPDIEADLQMRRLDSDNYVFVKTDAVEHT